MKSQLHFIFFALIGLFLISGCDKEAEEVVPKTSLEITLNNSLGNPVLGANVKLYASQTDLENGTNQIGTTHISNANGKVTFTDLQAIKYFWRAEKDCENNLFGSVTTSGPLTASNSTLVNSILTGTGTLNFVNNSTNPYQVFVNGTLLFTAQGGSTSSFTAKIGSYSIRVLQVSGYLFTPTDKTYTGNLVCGSSLTTTFPN